MDNERCTSLSCTLRHIQLLSRRKPLEAADPARACDSETSGGRSCLLELELDAPCRSGLGSGEAEAREIFDKHSAVSAVRLASISLGYCGNRASVMQQVECL